MGGLRSPPILPPSSILEKAMILQRLVFDLGRKAW